VLSMRSLSLSCGVVVTYGQLRMSWCTIWCTWDSRESLPIYALAIYGGVQPRSNALWKRERYDRLNQTA
jgi:hypothetical protein